MVWNQNKREEGIIKEQRKRSGEGEEMIYWFSTATTQASTLSSLLAPAAWTGGTPHEILPVRGSHFDLYLFANKFRGSTL